MTIYGGPDIITDGLVLHLDAANSKSYPGSGTTWTDMSGNNNNGTLTNGPSYSNTSKGSIVFDGTNDFVSLNNTISTDTLPLGSSARTIEIWSTPSSSAQNIFSYGSTLDATGVRWSITLQSNTVGVAVNYCNRGITNLNTVKNNFNQLVTIFPQSATSSDSIKIYLNGSELLPLANLGGSTVTINTSSPDHCWLGKNASSTTFSNSNISSIKIYSKALNQNEILQNYNAIKGRFGL